MSGFVEAGVTGGTGESLPQTTVEKIGKAAARLDELADQLKSRADETEEWKSQVRKDMDAQSVILTQLKNTHDAEVEAAAGKARDEQVADLLAWSRTVREPSKAGIVGAGSVPQTGYEKGAFLYAIHEANARDSERQAAGKQMLADLVRTIPASQKADLTVTDGKATLRQDAWGQASMFTPGYEKSTLGSTDATGGWIVPNAIVDELIRPASVDNIYRTLCTSVPGVTAYAVDIPFRSAARTRAAIAAFGATKDNRDLAYNGYTATMYTLAAIYDLGNQFLRQSRGAAEADVMAELASAFAQGESYYVREGSGSSQPYGYTSALTSGPSGFRSSFSPSATTLAGSMATAIATAAGAAQGRGAGGPGGRGLSAVLSASSYWTMLSQGTDSAGFFFNPAGGPTAVNAPAGTLISPFGIPVYPDADADLEGTAAVIDNLVVGEWKRFKVYYGQSYRVDSSDVAGTRWDTNLTGFRGEEEMGFDARPAVYAGYFQMVTDITP